MYVCLFECLGGLDEYVKNKMNQNGIDDDDNNSDSDGMSRLDVDTLLAYSSCDKFSLQCLENELPPNLIHCMRLLRVLELQRAHLYIASREGSSEDASSTDGDLALNIVPSSKAATKKVEKLNHRATEILEWKKITLLLRR